MFSLIKLTGCNIQDRYSAWNKTGGPLANDRTIGCGINALTFLGLFTRDEGNRIVEVLRKSEHRDNGTSFQTMMNYVVTKHKNKKRVINDYTFDISTHENMRLFLDLMTLNLGKNACTVVKLNRSVVCPVTSTGLTPGHTIVLSTDSSGNLSIVDPQQTFNRPRKDDLVMFEKSWKKNCYVSASVMVSIQQHQSIHNIGPLNPTDKDIENLVKSFTTRRQSPRTVSMDWETTT
jgi:hypothetical protein